MEKKYLILTYGCQMNVHESEKLAGILEQKGFVSCTNALDADVVVFNTCAIRENAEQKIYGNIGELKNIKLVKPEMIIAVCGCMSQQKGYSEEILKRFPFVDIIFGTHNLAKFDKFLDEKIERNKNTVEIVETENISLRDSMEAARTSGVNAWVNIMYGCNNFCTYCIVPYVRGGEISRPEHEIVFEVEKLLKQGYKQITLLGQNVNSYKGLDEFGNESNFAKLLKRLDELDYDYWLRFMTSHPKDLSSEVIDVIAESKHICHGIHLPIQSGSDKVLASMNRKYTKESYLSLIQEIKSKIPDAELTTDIIVGFPGENEEDFLETLDVMKKVEYMQIFGFIYSKRKGTVAEKMANHVETKEKKARLSRLLELKNQIIDEKTKKMLGKNYRVLVESFENGKLYGSLNSGKTITFDGPENCVGHFIDVEVSSVRHSVIYGKIADGQDIEKLEKLSFKSPIKVSILPNEKDKMKILRKNKQAMKDKNDLNSKK